MDLLYLITLYEQTFSNAAIDVCFKNADTQDYLSITIIKNILNNIFLYIKNYLNMLF